MSAPPFVQTRSLTKTYLVGDVRVAALEDVDAGRRRRPLRRRHRGLGLGQIDPPQPPRRPGHAERRDDRGRRGPHLGDGPGGAGPLPEVRRRHDLPVLQPRPGPHRPRERRAAPHLLPASTGRRRQAAGRRAPRQGRPGPPGRAIARRSSRAANSSAWPSPGPWPTARGSSWPTSRPATSTAATSQGDRRPSGRAQPRPGPDRDHGHPRGEPRPRVRPRRRPAPRRPGRRGGGPDMRIRGRRRLRPGRPAEAEAADLPHRLGRDDRHRRPRLHDLVRQGHAEERHRGLPSPPTSSTRSWSCPAGRTRRRAIPDDRRPGRGVGPAGRAPSSTTRPWPRSPRLPGVETAYPDINFPALVGLEGEEEFRLVQVVPGGGRGLAGRSGRVGPGLRVGRRERRHRQPIAPPPARGRRSPRPAVGKTLRITSGLHRPRPARLARPRRAFCRAGAPPWPGNTTISPSSASPRSPAFGGRARASVRTTSSSRRDRPAGSSGCPFTSVWDLFRLTDGRLGYSAVSVRLGSPRDLEPVKARVREMGFSTFALADQFDEIKQGLLLSWT